MIVLHGPPTTAPTGLGLTLKGLAQGLKRLGVEVVTFDPDPEGPAQQIDGTWSLEAYHIVVNQPMLHDPGTPWHAFMPFFELPPRPDEKPKLKLGGKRRILCANSDIQRWCQDLNPNADWPTALPLAQLGADPTPFDVSRVPGSIVTVGKAEPRKGTRLLLRALKQLDRQAYLAITHPLHTQTEIERLQEYADEGGHTLLPFSPSHEDILALLASCHVAVFPACAEGWNLGLTEALAQGCVVVASDIPAHRHQRDILVEGWGQERVDAQLILVRTKTMPMTHHQRWYPALAYPRVTWRECALDDLSAAISEALERPTPTPRPDFPLSWQAAAQRLCDVLEYPLA
jgi:glycosyltransferase involved in cell wall biosynthesis